MKSVENKVANAILQKPVEIVIGKKKYEVAPPSVATLILASAAISKLPKVEMNSENIVFESLNIAKDCEVLGEILAILILGAKQIEKKGSLLQLLTKRNYKEILAKQILNELSPKELNDLFVRLLSEMELSFFFSTTTSLLEINLLRKTKGST